MPKLFNPVAETKKLARAPNVIRGSGMSGVITGYASLFGETDLGGDLIIKGAFADSLKKTGAERVRMLFQHDPAQPIGVWEEIREDSMGLRVRGRLCLKVEKAREVWALIEQGGIDGLSIGFKAVNARRDARSGVRRLERIDLWEISIVTFPMLPAARVSATKETPLFFRSERAPFGKPVTRHGARAAAEALFRR
jgi:HK97 family phage prohead protease